MHVEGAVPITMYGIAQCMHKYAISFLDYAEFTKVYNHHDDIMTMHTEPINLISPLVEPVDNNDGFHCAIKYWYLQLTHSKNG